MSAQAYCLLSQTDEKRKASFLRLTTTALNIRGPFVKLEIMKHL